MVTCISCYHWNHYDLLTNRSLSALSQSNHQTWASNPLMWLPVFIEGIYCYRLWWGFDMAWCATQEMLQVWNILELWILIKIKCPTKIKFCCVSSKNFVTLNKLQIKVLMCIPNIHVVLTVLEFNSVHISLYRSLTSMMRFKFLWS